MHVRFLATLTLLACVAAGCAPGPGSGSAPATDGTSNPTTTESSSAAIEGPTPSPGTTAATDRTAAPVASSAVPPEALLPAPQDIGPGWAPAADPFDFSMDEDGFSECGIDGAALQELQDSPDAEQAQYEMDGTGFEMLVMVTEGRADAAADVVDTLGGCGQVTIGSDEDAYTLRYEPVPVAAGERSVGIRSSFDASAATLGLGGTSLITVTIHADVTVVTMTVALQAGSAPRLTPPQALLGVTVARIEGTTPPAA